MTELPAKSESVFKRDRLRYQNMLQVYVVPHLKLEKEKLRVISVGCGYAKEAGGFLLAFPGIYYEGIDNDPKDINANETRFNHDLPTDRVTFRIADATDPEAYGKEQWDIVYVGHPDIGGRYKEVSREIIRKSSDAVRPEGIIAVTTYDYTEHEEVRDLFEDQGKFDITVSERNLFAGEEGIGVGYVLVGVKRV